jgi:ATP-dependent Clp protease adaptor protein ClpS
MPIPTGRLEHSVRATQDAPASRRGWRRGPALPHASSEPGLGRSGISDTAGITDGPLCDGCAYPDGMAQTAPVEIERPVGDEDVAPDVPWIVIVWNDPINLMSYVVYVFQKLFGYPRDKATKLMLDVHQKGRAVVSSGPRERCEFDVSRLHAHGLWATLQKDR